MRLWPIRPKNGTIPLVALIILPYLRITGETSGEIETGPDGNGV